MFGFFMIRSVSFAQWSFHPDESLIRDARSAMCELLLVCIAVLIVYLHLARTNLSLHPRVQSLPDVMASIVVFLLPCNPHVRGSKSGIGNTNCF